MYRFAVIDADNKKLVALCRTRKKALARGKTAVRRKFISTLVVENTGRIIRMFKRY